MYILEYALQATWLVIELALAVGMVVIAGLALAYYITKGWDK